MTMPTLMAACQKISAATPTAKSAVDIAGIAGNRGPEDDGHIKYKQNAAANKSGLSPDAKGKVGMLLGKNES